MAISKTPVPAAVDRAAALRGTAWNFGALAGSKVVTLAATAILARLLVPADFGIVALGLVVLTYLDAVRDLGVGAAVVQREGDDERTLATALTLSVISGAAVTALIVLAAPVFSSAFRAPGLTGVLRLLATSVFVTSLGAVPEARLRNRLAFRARVVPEAGRAVAKGAVAIALAASGAGVWSLAWGQLAGSAVGSTLYWRAGRMRLRFAFDRAIARELWRYGAGIMALGVLSVVARDIDYVIVGRQLGDESLGYYSVGFRLPDLAVMSVCYAFSQTLFPVFSRLRSAGAELPRAFLAGMQSLTLATLPLGIGIAVVAPDAVEVLFGPRWASAAPVVRLLALYAVARTVGFVAGDLCKATDRTRVLVGLALIEVPIAVVALNWSTRWGIEGVAGMQLAIAGSVLAVEFVLAARISGVRAPAILGALGPAVAGAAGTGALAAAARLWLEEAPAPVRLGTAVAAGTLGFVAAVLAVARPALREMLAVLRRPDVAT